MSSRPNGSRRYAIRVRGTVQAVGFRPAMYRLARGLALVGFVRNQDGEVWIEVEGEGEAVTRFLTELRGAAPPASRIDSVDVAEVAPRGDLSFTIAGSERGVAGRISAGIPPDLAPCAACLAELEDPHDRRYRYPFINCTDCGPRFSIVRRLPYDRGRTTMDVFPLCEACRHEYEDPSNRRFHAEPNACPDCGPRLTWVTERGPVRTGEEALLAAVRALSAGAIVAVKGAGGFALAVDAADEPAVARLRRKKRRPHKPFAVMAQTLELLEEIAHLDDGARAALRSPARPIVLAKRRACSGRWRGRRVPAQSVAPGLVELGLFLPPTPLQHLLFCGGPPLLVMTSGNLSAEPIARTNREALARLGRVADGFLLHDREIHARVDDSVARSSGGSPVPVRRARGRVPEPIPLPVRGPPLLAVGGDEKSAVCLARGGSAFLSQHIGDLDGQGTRELFEVAIEHLRRLLDADFEAIACDLHPEYRSTRFADRLAREAGLTRVVVQHHHAHVAACLVEHGLTRPVLGVAFDGTGYGADDTLWGGEILEADLTGFRRLAHLRPIALAGGEAAIREPWRLALAALCDAGEGPELLAGRLAIDPDRLRRVEEILARRLASPTSSGAGRWFDAVAALCGVRDRVSYEGQAAIELEAAAAAGQWAPYPLALERRPGSPTEIDLRPAVREIASELRAGAPAAAISARFHETLAQAIFEALRLARAAGAPEVAALTGGCFQNRRLAGRTRELLEAGGFRVLTHRLVPPGDGGLALGQAAVAWQRLAQGKER